MMEPGGNEPLPASSFKLQKFLFFLLKYWPIPVVTLILGSAVGIAYVRTLPPTFVSYAKMWETVRLRLPDGGLFSDDSQYNLGTQTELLQSGELNQLTLERLKTLNTNGVPLEKDGQPPDIHLDVSGSARSTVFTVLASSSNPAYVHDYLEALITEYLRFKQDTRNTVSTEEIDAISGELGVQERKLQTAQDALSTYERTNNLFILEEQGRVTGSYLATLDTQVEGEKLELRLLEGTTADQQRKVASKPGAPMNGVPAPAAATNSTASTNSLASTNSAGVAAGASLTEGTEQLSTDKELELLKFERNKLSVFLRPKHPKIVKLDDEIARSEKVLDMTHNESQEQLVANREALRARIAGTEAEIKESEAIIAELNTRMAEEGKLQRDVSRIQVGFERLNGILNNVQISQHIDLDTLHILDHATAARRSYQVEIGIVTRSVFGGLFAGVAIVFLIALRDDRFASSEELGERFGHEIVGQVPNIPGGRNKLPLALVEDNDERHMYAESYRNLRSALLFLATEGERPKLLLITSAVPNEGKSTIASNLARILAIGGARVLLVDGDMRRGALHEVMGLRQEPGLTELLRKPGELEAVLQTNSMPNLTFIGRGGNVYNPGDLLLRPELDEVLAVLRERFDYVVIDSCPVFASDDATTLAPKIDGTLFVVRGQFSRGKMVQEALESLHQRQARVLGLVFNRANSTSRSNYHYYKYTQYYGAKKTA